MSGSKGTRRDEQAPDNSGHPAANSGSGFSPRAELNKSGAVVKEEDPPKGPLAQCFRPTAS
jgi:hypothetical protein